MSATLPSTTTTSTTSTTAARFTLSNNALHAPGAARNALIHTRRRRRKSSGSSSSSEARRSKGRKGGPLGRIILVLRRGHNSAQWYTRTGSGSRPRWLQRFSMGAPGVTRGLHGAAFPRGLTGRTLCRSWWGAARHCASLRHVTKCHVFFVVRRERDARR